MRLNTKRYITLFANAIDELLPEPDQQYQEEDVFDVMLHQRMQAHEPAEGDEDAATAIPADLRRRFEVRTINSSFLPPLLSSH